MIHLKICLAYHGQCQTEDIQCECLRGAPYFDVDSLKGSSRDIRDSFGQTTATKSSILNDLRGTREVGSRLLEIGVKLSEVRPRNY